MFRAIGSWPSSLYNAVFSVSLCWKAESLREASVKSV